MNVNIWRLITHHEHPDKALVWTRQNERIAVGWGKIGDIGKQGYNTAREIGFAIQTHYPHLSNSHLGGPSLWNLYQEMKEGDLVILTASRPRVLVVEVTGEYKWESEAPHPTGDYQHQRHQRH